MAAESNIGRNIRILRECYGETQLQLANILDLNSVGAISNYENGTRIPERPILEKLALHYCATVDELMGSDLSDLGRISLDGVSLKSMLEQTEKLFPMFETEDCLKNESFRRAYEVQKEIMAFIRNGGSGNVRVEGSPWLYRECIDECGAPAVANLAAWVFLVWLAVSSPKANSAGDDMVRELFVKSNCRDIDLEDEDARKEYSAKRSKAGELDRELTPLLRRLRSEGEEFAELAEYYVAMSYFSNLVSRNLSEDAIRLVGEEMFEESCRLGNRFSLAVKAGLNGFMKM